MPVDLLSGIPEASPQAAYDARTAAGLSQEQAAQLVGLKARKRWYEYEAGDRNIDTARWAMFLLATGQHPAYRAAKVTART